jgi:hypothetical protein
MTLAPITNSSSPTPKSPVSETPVKTEKIRKKKKKLQITSPLDQDTIELSISDIVFEDKKSKYKLKSKHVMDEKDERLLHSMSMVNLGGMGVDEHVIPPSTKEADLIYVHNGHGFVPSNQSQGMKISETNSTSTPAQEAEIFVQVYCY